MLAGARDGSNFLVDFRNLFLLSSYTTTQYWDIFPPPEFREAKLNPTAKVMCCGVFFWGPAVEEVRWKFDQFWWGSGRPPSFWAYPSARLNI